MAVTQNTIGGKSTQTLTCTISKMYCINVTEKKCTPIGHKLLRMAGMCNSCVCVCVCSVKWGLGRNVKIVSTPSLLLFILSKAGLRFWQTPNGISCWKTLRNFSSLKPSFYPFQQMFSFWSSLELKQYILSIFCF